MRVMNPTSLVPTQVKTNEPTFAGLNDWLKEIHRGRFKQTKANLDEIIRDSYDKHWDPDRDLNWNQDVRQNLRNELDKKSSQELLRLAKIALPVLEDYPAYKKRLIVEKGLPSTVKELTLLKETLVERQFKALKDIANHAVAAEQTSVSALSGGIKMFEAYPKAQRVFTQFDADEATHADTIQRYLEEKLGGKAGVQRKTVYSFKGYEKLAMVSPAAAMFMALAIETVGGSFFEFFGKRSPEPLFREMCAKIAHNDEKRHMKTCSTLFNEFYRKENLWSRIRNRETMKVIATEIYGDAAKETHYLMQACRAFGQEPKELLGFIKTRLQEEFDKIGFDFSKTVDLKQVNAELKALGIA